MSDDQLLRSLGRLAREEEEAESARLDERWDRLAAGTLTPEEEAELRALADTSPETREIYEAFRPLDAGFQARVMDAINRERGSEAPAPERPEPPPRTLPFRRGGARLAWLAAAGLAAASLLLFLRMPPEPPLPSYAAELSGGTQPFRGTTTGPPAGPQIFTYGDLLTLVARPRSAVEGPVEAQTFLDRSGEIVPWEPVPSLEKLENGVVRLHGRVVRPRLHDNGVGPGEVRLRPGPVRIWLVVGRAGDLPPPDELAGEIRAGRTRSNDWQAMFKEVRVQVQP